jgi:hypothetical protein
MLGLILGVLLIIALQLGVEFLRPGIISRGYQGLLGEIKNKNKGGAAK